jgi:molecular chaperone DnaK
MKITHPPCAALGGRQGAAGYPKPGFSREGALRYRRRSMPRIVGIDLGTTNSLVAFLDGERPQIIPNRHGKRLTPSLVGADEQGRLVVGEAARAQRLTRPEETVAEVKRLMGTSRKVPLGGRDYSPTEISALILRQLKEDAERFFGEAVPEAVITVPAYFTDAQRQATKDAGEIVGFKVERILNEPTAAALAYGLDHLDAEKLVLVYDFGGGTLDVSVLEMFQGVLDVKASSGNARLGGADLDEAIVAWACERIEREQQLFPRADAQAMARLKAACERAKIDLSAQESVRISLPGLLARGQERISIELQLSRPELEQLIGPLVRSTLVPVQQALRDARLSPQELADVVVVGGSSRVPLVRRTLEEFFGKPPLVGVDPDEAIALGAAVQAGLKSGQVSSDKGILISDVCPFTLGVEVSARAGRALQGGHFSPIIPRNSTVPISRTETYHTTGHAQSEVTVRVFQGEGRLTRENVFLDEYTVSGIPPAPAGSEKVAITFAYDINGILEVKTRVVSTGKEAALKVEKNALRLSPEEAQAAKERVSADWEKGREARPQAGPADERADLLRAAREKAALAGAGAQERIAALCARLEASAPGSPEEASADKALVDALFEL